MTSFAALEHRFRVRCDHPGVAERLRTVLEPLASDADDDAVVSYELIVDRSGRGPFELWRDDELVVSSERPPLPYAHLLQQINHHANLLTAHTSTVLHSAAAIGRDGPILLPAPMESGKSTLVTEMVLNGWAYLTDELVALAPETCRVRAFPRSISLDRGSWPLFPQLEPHVDAATRRRMPAQWQVPPSTIGRIGTGGRLPAAIVTHGYDPTRPTELTELDPVECLRRLIRCCFSFDGHVERDLGVLAALIDRTPCFELTVGTLRSARELLIERFGQEPAGTVAPA